MEKSSTLDEKKIIFTERQAEKRATQTHTGWLACLKISDSENRVIFHNTSGRRKSGKCPSIDNSPPVRTNRYTRGLSASIVNSVSKGFICWFLQKITKIFSSSVQAGRGEKEFFWLCCGRAGRSKANYKELEAVADSHGTEHFHWQMVITVVYQINFSKFIFSFFIENFDGAKSHGVTEPTG